MLVGDFITNNEYEKDTHHLICFMKNNQKSPLHDFHRHETATEARSTALHASQRAVASRVQAESLSKNASPIQVRPAFSSITGQRKNPFSLTSPRTYGTARSSLASYATAPSAPKGGWMMHRVDEEAQLNSLLLSEEMIKRFQDLLSGKKNIDPLVERVYQRVLSAFQEGQHMHELSDTDKSDLKTIIQKSLESLERIEYKSDEENGTENDSEEWSDTDDDEESNEKFVDQPKHSTESTKEETDGNKESDVENNVSEKSTEDGDIDPFERLKTALSIYAAGIPSSQLYQSLEEATRKALELQVSVWISQFRDGELEPYEPPKTQVFSSEWLSHLHKRGILLDPKDELDWSGRGQHVEYLPEEETAIPLTCKKVLGHSATALVESVQCRRILLARKKIRCNRRINKEDMIVEVEHLQKLQHRHIVRIVGTYTFRKDLAILLYPVAEMNLEEYMDEAAELPQQDPRHGSKVLPLFFGCLSTTLRFIHDNNIKHMDIKPKNVLVRRVKKEHRVYIADFGIARAYQSADEAFTDSPTSFTRTYAAPEVVQQDTRGFAADIFSLGCVFMEMLAVIISSADVDKRGKLLEARGAAYHSSIEAVNRWYQKSIWAIAPDGYDPYIYLVKLNINEMFLKAVPDMLNEAPEARPQARDLTQRTNLLHCASCSYGTEPFEAYESTG